MPYNQQGLDLKALKTDPKMWMRLAMPSKNGKYLENVFKDKENPFEKNNQAAVETLEKLAAEGKLYLRDFGRSRHFQKVEKGDDGLKLGAQHEIKLSNSTAGFGLSVLMRLSRAYFKWIGLERISNWFDGRLKRRAELNELNSRYKEEYKSLTKEEKKELKALRKHEKNLKKLENFQKEVNKTQQELDELRGVNTKGEMDSPLSQPPTVEQKENTMQPTLLGDQPVQQIPPAPPLPNQFAVNQTTQQEIPGTTKEENEQGENTRDNKITINGVELTEETAKQFPPQIVEAFKLIQQHINEKEAKEKTNQQPVQESQQVVNENKQEGPLATAQTQVVEEPQVTEQVPQTQLTETEQIFSNNPAQPTADEKVPDQEIDSPLKNGADLEPNQVNAQERPKDQAQKDLQERLAAEKDAMDAVQNWKDFVANSLFSHEEGRSAKEFYQNVNKNNEAAGAEYLTGAVFGILSNRSVNPEQKQQVMDALLSGKPLGSENAKLIDDGIAAYNDAIARKTSGSPERLVNMLADSMRELGHQASRETTLSPRLVMIGRLLSNAAQMTNENNLELPIDEDEFSIVKGAGTLADVAQKYHDARQRLGNDLENISSKENRGAVRDLLMGNAVEKMIQQDKRLGQTITNTQMIMGGGLWEVKKLQTYTSDTATRRGIQPEDIQAILKKPNSTKALSIGTKIGNEVVKASMEDYNAAEKAMQKEMELGQQENQVEINPIQMPV
ncbi:MAG: hypothetical protein U0L92_05010 [Clostridia bacterium]|nr:hypothetical protein [Clostridia bacterium]